VLAAISPTLSSDWPKNRDQPSAAQYRRKLPSTAHDVGIHALGDEHCRFITAYGNAYRPIARMTMNVAMIHQKFHHGQRDTALPKSRLSMLGEVTGVSRFHVSRPL